MSVSGLTQETKTADYPSAGVTTLAAINLGSSSVTGFVAHEDCSQGVFSQPAIAFHIG